MSALLGSLGTVVTAAVRPTPELPRPVVLMASGAMESTKRSSWLLAVDGSPTSRMLMSPRMCVPLARLRSRPPRSMSASACLMYLWP